MAFRQFIDREDKLFCLQQPVERGPIRRTKLPASSKKLFILRRDASPSRGVKLGTLGTEQNAEVGLTNSNCVCQHCFKHRREIARRRADDLEHVGSGGLVLQRLAQIVRSLTQFFEKARILNGDDSLIRKCLDERDLLVAEYLRLKVSDANSADDPVVSHHRSEDGGTEAKLTRELLGRQRHRRVVLNLRELEHLFALHCPTTHRIFIKWPRVIVD